MDARLSMSLKSQSVGIVEQFVDPLLDRLPGVNERVFFRTAWRR
jgi:hypothetical protein